jgi:Mg2+ and Co2+ transporter CorA
MRVFLVSPEQFTELHELPEALPAQGFIWVGSARREFELRNAELQAALQRWTGGQLVDLHVSDLLNNQLPSHFDYTSWYDMLVFRRLAAGAGSEAMFVDENKGTARSARAALAAIDTSPVGFALFDHVLITVHPTDGAVRDFCANRRAGLSGSGDMRGAARMPGNPADLMLRMVNHMVDSYLDLRRLLTKQLGTLQAQLLDPRSRFSDWQVLLESRNALHMLEDTCEDQRSAVQEWIDSLDEWPAVADAQAQRERELLRVRSRDVLEHIERVLTHERPGPPHQRHHAHADGADGHLPAAEPDHRLLRHELRGPAADPLAHRFLGRLRPDGGSGRGAGGLLPPQALPGHQRALARAGVGVPAADCARSSAVCLRSRRPPTSVGRPGRAACLLRRGWR